MNIKYKYHPWHGVDVGEKIPEIVTTYIEMVPTDTVKYELDKETGFLRIDRPQLYSSSLPALYGFIPKSLCGDIFANYCMKHTNKDVGEKIIGDGDPLDICILTERDIAHGDILISARPIGGFRLLDGNEADDKIIAIMENDPTYSCYSDISELPKGVINRLKHYFLTYKDMPGKEKKNIKINETYGREESYKVIELCLEDYKKIYK